MEKPAKPESKPVVETAESSHEQPKEKVEDVQVNESETEKDKEDGKNKEGGEKEEGEGKEEEEEEKAKPQHKAPPKFGVGLPMGPMGGDLLAEMKKRTERSNSGGKKVSTYE